MRIIVFLSLCCLLSSCGKSGALYLPSDKVDVKADVKVETQQTESN